MIEELIQLLQRETELIHYVDALRSDELRHPTPAKLDEPTMWADKIESCEDELSPLFFEISRYVTEADLGVEPLEQLALLLLQRRNLDRRICYPALSTVFQDLALSQHSTTT